MPDVGDHTQQDVTPRCRDCGRFMELYDDSDDVLLYQCCGREKAVPKPNRVMPEDKRYT